MWTCQADPRPARSRPGARSAPSGPASPRTSSPSSARRTGAAYRSMSRAVDLGRRLPVPGPSTPEPRLIGVSALSSRSLTVQHDAPRLRHLPGDRHRRSGGNSPLPARPRSRRRSRPETSRSISATRIILSCRADLSCSPWRHWPSCWRWPSGVSPPAGSRPARARSCWGPRRSSSAHCSSPARCAAGTTRVWPGFIGGVVCAGGRDPGHPAAVRAGARAT